MDLVRVSKSSPTANTATFSFTPKRSLSSQRAVTPHHSTGLDEDDKGNDHKQTPRIRNPFDVKAESLYFSACSPSVFATFSKNKKTDGTFRWSIDQLSVLYPTDIDESALPEPCVDSDEEKKAQKAIDAFFSQNSIVPSPWSNSSSEKKQNELKFRRKTRVGSMFEERGGIEASTQTSLSIPPDVDLRKILGEYFTHDNNDNSMESFQEEADSLSTSSLRRKLFASDDCSPEKIEKREHYTERRWSTPTIRMRSVHSTPASDVLSSSPVTPANCSDACNVLCSPPVSPISTYPMKDDSRSVSFTEEIPPSTHKAESAIFSDNAMSFTVDSQEPNPEKADTGYVTGSISSSQNITSTDPSVAGFVSRITPVTELMEECGLSNSATCDMSYECGSAVGFEPCTQKVAEMHSWLPNFASTPAHNLEF